MSISKLRGLLYRLARLLGDVNAVLSQTARLSSPEPSEPDQLALGVFDAQIQKVTLRKRV